MCDSDFQELEEKEKYEILSGVLAFGKLGPEIYDEKLSFDFQLQASDNQHVKGKDTSYNTKDNDEDDVDYVGENDDEEDDDEEDDDDENDDEENNDEENGLRNVFDIAFGSDQECENGNGEDL
jgi:hypothetical protein